MKSKEKNKKVKNEVEQVKEDILENIASEEEKYHTHVEIPEAIMETFGKNSITTLGEEPEKKNNFGTIIIIILLIAVIACAAYYFLICKQ